MGAAFPNLSLRDLEYVATIADLLHFGKAAKHCGVTQPALSGQVKKLETLLRAKIFDRSSRKIALTPTGEQIVERVRLLLRDAKALIDVASESGPMSRPFRLGAIPSLGPFIFPRITRPIMNAFPDMRLRVIDDDAVSLSRALKSGTIDGALISGTPDDKALVSTKLFFEPFVLVHKHDDDPVWPPRSGAAPMIAIDADLSLNEDINKLGRRYPDLKMTLRCTGSFEMLRQMIATGEGASLVPALAAAAMDPRDGLTKSVAIDDAKCGRTVLFCRRRADARATLLSEMAALIRSCIGPVSSRAASGRQAAHRLRNAVASSKAPSRSTGSNGRSARTRRTG